MAEIPTVTAPTLTPPPEMNPGIAGKPGEAMAQAADQFAGLAEYGVRETDLLKKAQDEGIMLGAENQIGADMEKAETQLANWTDYTHADELKKQTADAIHEKYVEQYGNRPDLWRHIEPYLGRQLNSYNALVDRRSTALTTDFNKSALFDSQMRTENDAATEPTIDGKERIWAIQDAKTDAMVRNGTITQEQATQAKVLLRSRTIATEVDRAANPLNAPEIMESEMSRLKEYEGKGYVDPKDLEQMQDHLAVSYERALDRSDRVDVSKKGDAVLASLKSDPTLKDPETREFDHGAAIKKLEDNPDIPTNVRKYVRTELEEEMGATQKIQNDTDQKMLDSLDPHVESGELTFAELTRRENLAPGQKDWIPRRVADHLLTRAAQIQRENRVTNVQERSMMRQEREDKSNEIAQELLGAGVPLVAKSDLTPYILKGLSQKDANALWATLDLQKDPGWQNAVKMLNASPVYDTSTDAGRAKLAHDTLQFARTVQAKKLTGAQITDELQNELHPQEESQKKQTVKTLLDNIWPIAKGIITQTPPILNIPITQSGHGEASAPARPKGVPDNAVWNGEAQQWQLPR